jgi:pyruvate formate lyase activating enzyme
MKNLKALTPEIYCAFTGTEVTIALENFKKIAEYIRERPEVPLLTASTLLVLGYVEEEEVEKIARFIAEINLEIPYRLLAFSPKFYMKDLPLFSKERAFLALEKAKKAGLKRISLGKEYLLRECSTWNTLFFVWALENPTKSKLRQERSL